MRVERTHKSTGRAGGVAFEEQQRAKNDRLWRTGEAGSVSRWLGHAGGRAMGSDELQQVAGGAARKELRPGQAMVLEGGRREDEPKRSGRLVGKLVQP